MLYLFIFSVFLRHGIMWGTKPLEVAWNALCHLNLSRAVSRGRSFVSEIP